MSSSTRQKSSDGVLSDKISSDSYKNGKKIKTTEYSAKEIVTESTTPSVMSTNAVSYSYLLEQYLSAHLSYAQLFGSESGYTSTVRIYARQYSTLDVVIIAAAGIIFGGESFTLLAFLKAVGVTVALNCIQSLLDEPVTQKVDEWSYELKIKDIDKNVAAVVASKGYISAITTDIYDTNGTPTRYIDYVSGGPYTFRQGFIDWGVYVYYLPQ